MAKVERATAEMFDDVCELLVGGMTTEEKKKQIDTFYRPLFNYKWNREEDYYGHVLVDQGKIVGFLGSYFVQRMINGKREKFCNLSTWMVKKENRSESLLLLMPILKLKDYTVTGFTVAPDIFSIYQKLGFNQLDSKVKLVPTFVSKLWNKSGGEVVTDRNELKNLLDENDRLIFDDHAGYKCQHLLIRAGNRYCYIVFSPVKKGIMGVANIQYISDLELFLDNIDKIKARILLEFRIPFLWIEGRFLRGHRIPFSVEYESYFRHFYRSSTLQPEDIDNLYAELVIYNTLENRPS